MTNIIILTIFCAYISKIYLTIDSNTNYLSQNFNTANNTVFYHNSLNISYDLFHEYYDEATIILDNMSIEEKVS